MSRQSRAVRVNRRGLVAVRRAVGRPSTNIVEALETRTLL